MAETSKGLVHYQVIGKAPYVLALHGSPGGLNDDMLTHPWLENGFGLILPARPGYMKTPIESGRTAAE